jgi:hypothetical protein
LGSVSWRGSIAAIPGKNAYYIVTPTGRVYARGDTNYKVDPVVGSSHLSYHSTFPRVPGGTVVFSLGPVLTGGSKKTSEFAVKLNKPCLHAHSGQDDVAQALRDFVADNEILTLNVAGPRESKEPGIAEFVREVLEKAFPEKRPIGI